MPLANGDESGRGVCFFAAMQACPRARTFLSAGALFFFDGSTRIRPLARLTLPLMYLAPHSNSLVPRLRVPCTMAVRVACRSGLAVRHALRSGVFAARAPAALFGVLKLRSQGLATRGRPTSVHATASGGAATGAEWTEWRSFIGRLAQDGYLAPSSEAADVTPDETGFVPAFGELVSRQGPRNCDMTSHGLCCNSGCTVPSCCLPRIHTGFIRAAARTNMPSRSAPKRDGSIWHCSAPCFEPSHYTRGTRCRRECRRPQARLPAILPRPGRPPRARTQAPPPCCPLRMHSRGHLPRYEIIP